MRGSIVYQGFILTCCASSSLKKDKMIKTIKVPIYGYKMVLSIGEEDKRVLGYINSKLRRVGHKLTDDEVVEIRDAYTPKILGFFLPLSVTGWGLLWVSKHVDLGKSDAIITLSHEINHLCLEIFDFINSDVSLQTQEPFCYLHDYIFDKCLIELNKINNGNSSTDKEPVGSGD